MIAFLRSLSQSSNEDGTALAEASSANAAGNASPGDHTKKSMEGVPDIEYDSPITVKNTFLDTGKTTPESLVGFYEQRAFQSEPPRDLGNPYSTAEDEDFVPTAPPPAGGRKLLGSTVSIAEAPEEDDDDDEDFVPSINAARTHVAPPTTTIKEEESTPACASTCAGTSPANSEDPQDGDVAGHPAYVSPPRNGRDAGLKGLKLEGLPQQRAVAPKVEQFDYPVFVKNTFIDTGATPPFSMVDPNDRKTVSCPTSAIGMPPGLHVEGEAAKKQREEGLLAEAALKALAATANGPPEHAPDLSGAAQWPATIPPPPTAPPVLPPVVDLAAETVPAAPAVLPGNAPVLMGGAPQVGMPNAWPEADGGYPGMNAMMPQFQLGTPEWPTLGSQEHYLGTCKPCAHAYAKGCQNGINCIFCHLCPPGELKRRQKEKRAGQRMQRNGNAT